MSLFTPAPEPKSKLGYYRLLSPTASIRVSPLCLGGMNFGTAWSELLGSMDKKEVFEVLDNYYDNGVCIVLLLVNKREILLILLAITRVRCCNTLINDQMSNQKFGLVNGCKRGKTEIKW